MLRSSVSCIAPVSPAFAGLGLDLFIFDPDDIGGASSRFMSNMGCNGGGNPGSGLVLFKLGPTTDLKAPGASITGVNQVNGDLCGADAVVGFQYRPDGWCGAGAPRFNITTKDGTLHFLGGTATTKVPDPESGCVTATIDVHDPGQAFPVIPAESAGDPTCSVKVGGLQIIFDEGSDVGPGFAVRDNINVNGRIIDGP